MKNLENLLKLVPEKYKELVSDNAWIEILSNIYNALSKDYQISEIVPMCMEEFIKLSATDLVLDSISYYDNLCVSTIEDFVYCEREDNGSKFYTLHTLCEGHIYDSAYCKNSFDNFKGFNVVNDLENDEPFDYLKPLKHQKLLHYTENWVFKIKSKELKKIVIDKPTLAFLELTLDEKDFLIAKNNFKKEDSNGVIIPKVV